LSIRTCTTSAELGMENESKGERGRSKSAKFARKDITIFVGETRGARGRGGNGRGGRGKGRTNERKNGSARKKKRKGGLLEGGLGRPCSKKRAGAQVNKKGGETREQGLASQKGYRAMGSARRAEKPGVPRGENVRPTNKGVQSQRGGEMTQERRGTQARRGGRSGDEEQEDR